MVVFEVKLNGKIVCTAGVGEFGFLFAEAMWDKRDPAFRPKGVAKKSWSEETLTLRATGFRRLDESLGEHLRWEEKSLSVGDKIVIRVLEQTECDPPVERVQRLREQATCEAPPPKRRARGTARKKAPRKSGR